MGWQKRLRGIALAGGLAGGCAGSTVVGTTGSSSSTGTGGAGTGGTGAPSSSGDGIPPCNANPDPCCPCMHGGQGGYGGAACIAQNGCQRELSCISTPTAACCSAGSLFNCGLLDACADAGFL